MTVQTNGFIYDDKTSDDFGLIICKIDGSKYLWSVVLCCAPILMEGEKRKYDGQKEN